MNNLEHQALEIWDTVCKNISLILKESDLYQLAGFLTIPDPSIESRINALKKLDAICHFIIENTEISNDGYSIIRIMHNAKQQILLLNILLSAAKRNDLAEFKRCKKLLSTQSPH